MVPVDIKEPREKQNSFWNGLKANVCCCLMGLLIGSVVVILAFNKFCNGRTIESVFCTDKECIETANNFLQNMDTSVDPCDDFYSFACGRFAKNNPIPDDKPSTSVMSKVLDLVDEQLQRVLEEPVGDDDPQHFRNLKMYYKSCMNVAKIEEVGLTKIKSLLSEVGGWPVADKTDEVLDWKAVLYGLVDKGFSGNYLLTFETDADYVNSTKRVLTLEPLSSTLQRASLTKGKDDPTIQAYLAFMVAVAQLFGADEDRAKEEMEAALDFEIDLAEASKPVEEVYEDILVNYNLYSIAKLQKEFPQVEWKDYFRHFLPEDLKIDENDEIIIVTEPEYLHFLFETLEKTDQRVVRNYMVWKAIFGVSSMLNEDVRKLEQNFIAALVGQLERLPRSKECTQMITKDLEPLVSSLYVRKYFDQYSKTVASELVAYIRHQFRMILNDTHWSPEDKKNAIDKINALYPHVAFPHELFDDNELNKVYKTLSVDEDDFLGNSLQIDMLDSDLDFEKLYEPINKTDWMDSANSAVVNAFYKPETNAIILTAAILQAPFFNARRPNYLNFGAIGFVIGHEISHGFDSIGHQLDKDGNVRNWWSEVAQLDFDKKKKCLVEQYNQFEIMDGLKVNGNLTLSENMADFGGLKSAYASYRRWRMKHSAELSLPGLNYTKDQLFWLSAANVWCQNSKPELRKYLQLVDMHSPGRFRVNGPMMNLEDFAKDFRCPIGTNMNPEKRCTPW